MQRLDLIQKILDYLKNLYKAKYKGFIDVNQNTQEYIFTIGIPSYMSPTHISGEFESDEEFLKFIYEELRIRNYMRIDYYKVIRTNDSKEE